MLHRILEPVFTLVFPAFCEACGRPLLPRAGRGLLPRASHRACPACLDIWLGGADQPKWRLDGLPGHSLGWYEQPATSWIHGIKSGREPGLLLDLADGWGQPPLDLPEHVLLVPIPADPLRRRSRGLDHVLLLAERWARNWGLSCRPLLRRRPGRKQQGLGATQRQVNLAEQYTLGRHAPLANLPLLLVDDVVTTGATLTVCRNLLESSGHQVAGALTLACTPRPEMRLAGLEHLAAEA